MDDVLIFGAGGHAVSVIDIFQTQGKYRICGVIDRNTSYEAHTPSRVKVFVAIGDNKIRQTVTQRLLAEGYTLVNAISPHAYVSASSVVGTGVCIMPHAVVGPNTKIGNSTIINTRASVDHDCDVADYCHIAPGSTLCGFVTVGSDTFICAGVTVIDRIAIGENCIVGAGAVVIRNVPNGEKVVGIPAKTINR